MSSPTVCNLSDNVTCKLNQELNHNTKECDFSHLITLWDFCQQLSHRNEQCAIIAYCNSEHWKIKHHTVFTMDLLVLMVGFTHKIKHKPISNLALFYNQCNVM